MPRRESISRWRGETGSARRRSRRGPPLRARDAGREIEVSQVIGDVAVVADCERLVAEALAHHGRLDILVNSAGVWLEKPILETSEADWDFCVDICLKGTYFMCRAALRHMLPRKSGVIVNIASDSGIHGEPGAAVYSAAKAGVIMLTRALAIDHGPDGIRDHERVPRHLRDADGHQHDRRRTGSGGVCRGPATPAARTTRCAATEGPKKWPPPSLSWPRTRRAS